MIVLLVIFCIGAIVVAHEFGHFMSAKLLGVQVKEFMLGLPSPKIVSFTLKGTKYGVTILPVGGYVKFVSTLEKEDLSGEELEQAFESQLWWKRVIIILAGPVMNLIVPIFLIASILMIGVPFPSTTIDKIYKGSAAKEAGMKAGDKIVAIDSEPVDRWDEVTAIIQGSAGKRLSLSIERGGERKTISIVPQEKDSKGFLGIRSKQVNQRFNPLSAIYQGAVTTFQFTIRIVQILFGLLTTGKILGALGSPVRITQELSREATRGYIVFLQSLSLISIGLAIANLIPLPPLDGGRILILGIEAVMGKPLDRDKLLWIQGVGFLLLMTLMIYLVVVDIQRLVPAITRL